jgi:hypothetical protein
MGIVLVACGLTAAVMASWRGYAAARSALGPFMHEGDTTRTAVEAGRPILARSRVRLFVRRVTVAVGWLLVAFYGLFLVSAGSVAQ